MHGKRFVSTCPC